MSLTRYLDRGLAKSIRVYGRYFHLFCPGNFLEIVQESFLVGADSIQLLLPKPEHEDYVESLHENYLIISLPLKYWARREW